VIVFFFQAEDGIRDGHVTGVQTCALPICQGHRGRGDRPRQIPRRVSQVSTDRILTWSIPASSMTLTFSSVISPPEPTRTSPVYRSEERRVGEEWRWRMWELR